MYMQYYYYARYTEAQYLRRPSGTTAASSVCARGPTGRLEENELISRSTRRTYFYFYFESPGVRIVLCTKTLSSAFSFMATGLGNATRSRNRKL